MNSPAPATNARIGTHAGEPPSARDQLEPDDCERDPRGHVQREAEHALRDVEQLRQQAPGEVPQGRERREREHEQVAVHARLLPTSGGARRGWQGCSESTHPGSPVGARCAVLVPLSAMLICA